MPGAVEPVRRGQAKHRRLDTLFLGEHRGGRERLRDDRTAGGDHDSVVGRRGLAKAEAARDDIGAQPLGADEGYGRRERLLVDRLGREPQIERLTVGRLHPGQRIEQQPFELPRIAGLGVCETGSLDPDPGRRDRLMGTSFAGQRDPGRSADENEP